jgi:hypothetical protein
MHPETEEQLQHKTQINDESENGKWCGNYFDETWKRGILKWKFGPKVNVVIFTLKNGMNPDNEYSFVIPSSAI